MRGYTKLVVVSICLGLLAFTISRVLGGDPVAWTTGIIGVYLALAILAN